jgi:CheY-like chemotaxis protein
MEDERIVRDIARQMIETLGHSVECAGDGEEALARFIQARESGMPFDVVSLDLTVKGGMGGEQAATKLREIDPTVKLIVTSGYSDNAVVSNYRSYGFEARLNKPYTIEALRESLNAVLLQS